MTASPVPCRLDHPPGSPGATTPPRPASVTVARWLVRIILGSLGVTALLTAVVLVVGQHPVMVDLLVVSEAGVVVPFLVLFALVMVLVVRQLLASLDQACTPLPPPAVVAEQFCMEHGRYPSAEEVQLVYTVLQEQQRQGMLTAGLALGALVLLGHGAGHS